MYFDGSQRPSIHLRRPPWKSTLEELISRGKLTFGQLCGRVHLSESGLATTFAALFPSGFPLAKVNVLLWDQIAVLETECVLLKCHLLA